MLSPRTLFADLSGRSEAVAWLVLLHTVVIRASDFSLCLLCLLIKANPFLFVVIINHPSIAAVYNKNIYCFGIIFQIQTFLGGVFSLLQTAWKMSPST